ncbi:hypothetical protein ACS0TY_013569 [Phlomoides rotata]
MFSPASTHGPTPPPHQSDAATLPLGKNDNGLKLYDPGYLNTTLVRSSICYIDGDEGVLRYRGYPIEELAEGSSFCGSSLSFEIGVSTIYSNLSGGELLQINSTIYYFLILMPVNGNLPSESQLADWEFTVSQHSTVPQGILVLLTSYMQCPMIMSALSIFHPHVNPTLKKQPLLTNNSTKETIWDNGGKCQESTKGENRLPMLDIKCLWCLWLKSAIDIIMHYLSGRE